jgi:hypothetical protein
MCYFFAIVGHYAKNLHWCLEITIVCYERWYLFHNWWLYFQMSYIVISIGSRGKPSFCKNIDFLPSHERLALHWHYVLYFTIIMSMPLIQTPHFAYKINSSSSMSFRFLKNSLFEISIEVLKFKWRSSDLLVSLILFHWEWTSCSLQSWSVAGAIAATMNKEKLMKVVLDHPNRERSDPWVLESQAVAEWSHICAICSSSYLLLVWLWL